VTFLAPLLLLGAVALAVPLLLHLFRKKERSIQTFPALRYLKRTSRERATLVRLRQILLLALRLAILAALILAGARLVVPAAGGDQPAAGLVIVVDNGLPSARVVDDRRVLDHLVQRAEAALARAGPLDRVWVLAAGEPWRPALPGGPAEARRQLGELEPSGAMADLPAMVARARSLLEAGAPELRQILILSDLNPATFPRDSGPMDGEIPVALWTPDTPLPDNRSLVELSLDGGLAPRAGRPVEVSIRVEGEPRADQSVRLLVDNDLAAAGRTDEDGRLQLRLPPQQAGSLVGRAELDPDPLRLDDVLYFALRIRPPPRVRAGEPLPPFLETALEVLADRDRIVLAASDGQVGVEAAGPGLPGLRPTLVVAPSDPSVLPAVNRRLAELGTEWRMEAVAEAQSPRNPEAPDPGLRLSEELVVRSAYRLSGPAGDRDQVRVRLSDGAPWIVHDPGEGPGTPRPGVVILASPLAPEASDLPTSASMIPFLAAALELLDGGEAHRETRAGEPIPIPAGARTLQTPAGTHIPVHGISSFLETGRPGVYRIRGEEGEALVQVAVQPAAAGAAERLGADEAAARLGGGAVGFSESRAFDRAVLADRRGREIWWPLALTAFLLLLVEGWVASSGARGAVSSSDRNPSDPAPRTQPEPSS
jgi:hypothetical protein